MNSFHCPFCNVDMPITDATHSIRYPSFNYDKGDYYVVGNHRIDESCIKIAFYKCPKCGKYSIFALEGGSYTKGLNIPLIPNSHAKQFPEYVPEPIRQDYEEAYSIVNLSPKASATLARRCLQGMIRDFHGITKSRLVDEINALKSLVPASQWKAIDALRSIGNIGAHMEKDINTIVDVDSGEAEKLLKLIELLIDKWYIARHDEEELFSSIETIGNAKVSTKKSNQSSASSNVS